MCGGEAHGVGSREANRSPVGLRKSLPCALRCDEDVHLVEQGIPREVLGGGVEPAREEGERWEFDPVEATVSQPRQLVVSGHALARPRAEAAYHISRYRVVEDAQTCAAI